MMDSQQVYLRLPSPLTSRLLNLAADATLEDVQLPDGLLNSSTYFRTSSSSVLAPSTRIASLRDELTPSHPVTLHLCVRLRGSKGGFGTNLRSAGNRMSRKTQENNDSCRDLSGRRLGTIKEAQRQAELLESAPALRAQAVAAEKAKLEALERQLGVGPAPDAEGSGSGESSVSGSKRLAELDLEELAKKKHRFDDSKFLQESEEIKDNVRSAVSAAMLLKKKKKPKADGADAGASTAAPKKADAKATMAPPAAKPATPAVKV